MNNLPTEHEFDSEFITRGLRAADESRKQGDYVSADAILAKLEERLAVAKKMPDSSPEKVVAGGQCSR